MILFPKGISQLAKTVLSIPTHLRNLFSAGAFAGANGTLFENPKLIKDAFQEAFGALQVGTRGEKANKAYRIIRTWCYKLTSSNRRYYEPIKRCKIW